MIMTQGVVKWFAAARGYGFITPDDGGQDVFVHSSAVEAAGVAALDENQRVEFTIEVGPRGARAEQVRLL
jgi:CspA family cold shock protein